MPTAVENTVLLALNDLSDALKNDLTGGSPGAASGAGSAFTPPQDMVGTGTLQYLNADLTAMPFHVDTHGLGIFKQPQ